MEKEKNKITLIHKDLFGAEEKTKTTFVYSCVDDKMIDFLLKNKNKERVLVIDKTHNKNPKKKKLFVKNHVNKTGENPIRGKQALSKEPFFDITSVYEKTKEGIITTSLGKKYSKMKNKEKHPSTYLSNIVILCKALGFNKITGVLINNQKA